MPLYEYKCINCNRHIEKIQKFSDPEITTCPHCEGQLERVLSAPAVAFKGGGWYADGYGNAKPKASSDSSSSSSNSNSSSSGSNSNSSSSSSNSNSSSSAPAASTSSSTSSSSK
jgi:putative FmdB family regulatory protein